MLFFIINDGGALDNAHRFKPSSPLLRPPWPGLLVSLPGIVRNINVDTNTKQIQIQNTSSLESLPGMKMPTLLRKAFKYLPLQAFLQPFCTPVQVPGNAHTRGHRTQPTACRVPSQPVESLDQEQRNNIKQQPT